MSQYFSAQSSAYAAFRPTYPPELFRWIASIAPKHGRLWDCGTGNGQAAVDLAAHFSEVIATDNSENQIAHAQPHPGVIYKVSAAESSGLASHSIDVVTVAQALHWFDLDAFYAEVRRVLVPNGVLVVWGYADPILPTPALNAIVARYNLETLASWWPAERHIVTSGYRTIAFPFTQVDAPAFALSARWTLEHLVGYLRSWSATVRYAESLGHDPVVAVEEELRAEWGDPAMLREIQWPLSIRAGM